MSSIKQTTFSSIEQVTGQFLNTKNNSIKQLEIEKRISFEEVFNAKKASVDGTELKFSKHANERLLSRNIDLSNAQMERLESGAKKAQEKGINESLVMVDDIAFIVNIKNNTVVTAVNDMDDQIFTNIDGAVIT